MFTRPDQAPMNKSGIGYDSLLELRYKTMDTMIKITICPSCGSDKVVEFQKDWTGNFKGKTYTVPSLEFWECQSCGEKIYDRTAMRKIEAHSPAFREKDTKRGSRGNHQMGPGLTTEPILEI